MTPYQEFKWQVIANLDRETRTLTGDQIRQERTAMPSWNHSVKMEKWQKRKRPFIWTKTF